MSDEGDRGTDGLVPLAGSGIVSRSTALVRRGLSHLEQEKPAAMILHVVIGDLENNLESLFVKLIEACGDYTVVPVTITHASALVEHARKESVDLFVLVLNNLSGYSSDRQRLPELVALLKSFAPVPIIALSGDALLLNELGERVRQSGAEAFLPLPFLAADFKAVVRHAFSTEGAEYQRNTSRDTSG